MFGAEQLLRYDEQVQDVLLSMLIDGKQAVIPGVNTPSTDVRLVCEALEQQLSVTLKDVRSVAKLYVSKWLRHSVFVLSILKESTGEAFLSSSSSLA